ncbi:MAG TPA: DUF1080 domain-containing protein [Vicinamibacterales bacterium]|nr:DUF1080 domain-containing protein [Vicinamibacterales bacterium]
MPPLTQSTAQPPRDAGGWRVLFDGTSLAGWRGYKQSTLPDGWKAQDGFLVRLSGGGDIVTVDEFGDFELALEWKVTEGGNSGIFYRALETTELIWHNAPEYQILDNARHRDGKDPMTSAGACYAVYAPAKDATKPAGQWNETRIVARGPHVEHWLNGVKVVEFEIGSHDWRRRVAASKFRIYAAFGEQKKGRIGLQDHGDVVWYRNIRIREPR